MFQFWRRSAEGDPSSLSLLSFLDATPEFAMILDRDGKLRHINGKLGSLWPIGRYLIGQRVWEALPDLDFTDATRLCKASLADRHPRSFTFYSMRTRTSYAMRVVPLDDFLILLFAPEIGGGPPS